MAGLIGQRLGNYEILSLLGEGGMAAVCRARQLNIKREVAIKIIKHGLVSADKLGDFVRRFEREAETIAALSHPHILKLFDYGQHEDLVYLVMELLPGGSLAQLIEGKPLTGEQTLHYLQQMASALDYAHGEGIIHRDLKPQNVLLDKQGNAILTDFGIARLVNTDATKLTASGMVMGTPKYMAPEQWQTRELDSRADLYALGVMVYEMLTGQPPYAGDTPFQLMHAHVYEPLPSIRDLRPDLPESVEAVLAKALAKAPDMRFQTAGDLAKALGVALSGKMSLGVTATSDARAVTDRTAPQPATDRALVSAPARGQPRTGLLAIGAVVILGAIGLLALLLSSRGSDAPTPTATWTATAPEVVVLAPTPTAQETSRPSATVEETRILSATLTPAALALVASDTPISSLTATFTRMPTPSFTATLPPTPTLTTSATSTDISAVVLIPSDTPTPSQTSTPTATLTYTATSTWTLRPSPTPTPTETPTPDVRAIALAMIQAEMTQTAALWTFTPTNTSTPTPNFAATIDAERTAIVHETQSAGETATAIIVASYTTTPTPTATATPSATATTALVTSNNQWTPVIQFFDGVEMVKVPAGCFMMGSTAEEIDAVFQQCEAHRGSGNCLREWFNEEQPRHRVCFSEPFWIDRTEVTNAQFAQFGGQAATASNRTNADRPRERIAWLEAQSFCERRGARLPTEAEWEYAARGPDGLTYPWGNTFVAANAVYEENARLQTAAVGSRPDGVSWVGALDMSGNVWEWVNDWHGTYGTGAADNPAGPATGRYRVLRGGSWIDNPSFLRVANRWLDPGSGSNIIGIRCARSF